MEILFVVTLCIIMLFTLISVQSYESFHGPTELIYHDELKALKGYTLFTPQRGEGTYLIDMGGEVVHTWKRLQNPKLLENGNVIGIVGQGPTDGKLQELDWEGNIVWQFEDTREEYSLHHDYARIFNKKLGAETTMFISNKALSHEEVIAAGCDPGLKEDYSGSQMDTIVEVDMDGNIIWEWRFIDHAVQDIDPSKANYAVVAENPGKIDLNWGPAMQRDWLHCNSMDYNRELDQCVINSVYGEFFVVDHGATFVAGDPAASIALAEGPDGDFVYRFGDPAKYKQGDPPQYSKDWTRVSYGDRQMGGTHDIQWIKPGLPGEGRFLIFDNGGMSYGLTQSRILEIDPYDNDNPGEYLNPPEAGYAWTDPDFRDTHKYPLKISNQIKWIFESKSTQSFFSHYISGCQRLSNGNTLACSGAWGHFFEVTGEGEVVWEYINPVTADGIVTVLKDGNMSYNSVFRCYRYEPDYPGLAGKGLTPGGVITDIG